MTENDRLTHEAADGSHYWSCHKKQELIDRLAAYEESGLDPDEVRKLWKAAMNG